MSVRYTDVELLDIVNDQHMHSFSEIETAIDTLEARGVISERVADERRRKLK